MKWEWECRRRRKGRKQQLHGKLVIAWKTRRRLETRRRL